MAKNRSRMSQVAQPYEEPKDTEHGPESETPSTTPEAKAPSTYTKEEWDLYLKTWEAGLANIFQFAPIGSVTQKKHFVRQCLHQNMVLCDMMIQQYRELNGKEGLSYEPNLD